MLRSIAGWKLQEWQEFEELDPPLSERLDWGLAHIVQVIVRNGKPLSEFMLPFGDYPGRTPVQQPVEYQEMLIDAWIQGSNAALRKRA